MVDERVTYYTRSGRIDRWTMSRRRLASRLERRPVRELEKNADYWVARKVTTNGIVCVGYQTVNVGQRNAGEACDILMKDGLLQFWVGSRLVRPQPGRRRA